ncbi:MAG: helix-turn-helix domain-containing protein [Candidatus Aminicenantes bacterium]|nr:helix-turn-helix domain-containing protein [Candidatus Aminicenantes bacterium]NIM82743.1 helix-turn-helix domain-containing protein [Candidatus Aminicenantes bacterium]NIN22120.1 helix-turn-helix domain-containing protein [Candidatus Aminicenantes bacterium]NIN45879.1 helix-turn-helix domain-containing protein [Candidatus Aminicenantes bacterium]NIN88716.1 helix-turn-helix domain-containing protein [Candidatus Aminicenantes bacterium]
MKDRSLIQGAGLRLKKVRELLNFPRKEMARRLDVKNVTYYKNENGETFPGLQTLSRLSNEFDISMDWFLFNKGPVYYKEKGSEAELEKAQEELEMEREKKGKKGKAVEETAAGTEIEMKPEVKALLAHMERIPLLYHEVLVHFQRFKIENRDLVEASMAEDPEQ